MASLWADRVSSTAPGHRVVTTVDVGGWTVDYKTLNREFLEYVGWDTETTVPSEDSLKKLGLEALVPDLK